MVQNLIFIFLIWLSTLTIGLVSLPFTMIFFNRLSDRGYSISKILGLFIIGYLLFFFTTFKILPLSFKSLLTVFFIWSGVNVSIALKYKVIFRHFPSLRQVLIIEFFFVILLGFWSFLRAHQPEIYGIERFMDFGFIQTLFSSYSLPLKDLWFLGKNLNYYYFGHFLGYVILSLSKIPPLPGFFVLVAWLFALVGINVYRLGREATFLLLSSDKSAKIIYPIGGFLSFFIVMLAGTWHTIVWGISYLYRLFFTSSTPAFWYPELTRIIPGTITEVPLYAFLISDLHAHVWGLLSGILVLTTLFLFLGDKNSELNFKNKYWWLLIFLLGIAFMINSLDGLTLGILTILFSVAKSPSFNRRKMFLSIFFIPICSYLVAFPWSFFSLPSGIKGLGIVYKHSPIFKWFDFWGTVIILIAVFLVTLFKEGVLKNKNEGSFFLEKRFQILITIATLFFLILMELVFVKDILHQSEWFRANTVFKISFQVWLWMGVVSGSIILWTIKVTQNRRLRTFLTLFFTFILLGQAIYPVKAIEQASLKNKKLTGLDKGLEWWQKKFPYDFEAYQFLAKLRDSLSQRKKMKNIVEAEGESYTEVSRFSIFLGWPTIIGWPVHEWTWRGNYDEIGKRREEVLEIYTGLDEFKTREILKKYAINYLIVGELERQRYPNLNIEKLLKMGKIIFSNEKTFIIEVGGL